MKLNINKKFRRGSGYEIPSEIPWAYEIDTVNIMPVNVNTSFIYWEITERLINRTLLQLNIASVKLMVKIFGRGRQKEIYSFDINEMIGHNYIDYLTPSKFLTAEVGIIMGRKFTRLLKSNTISVPYVENRNSDKETWMKKTGDICKIVNIAKNQTPIAKEREFLEYCRKSVSSQESPSSVSLLPVMPTH